MKKDAAGTVNVTISLKPEQLDYVDNIYHSRRIRGVRDRSKWFQWIIEREMARDKIKEPYEGWPDVQRLSSLLENIENTARVLRSELPKHGKGD